jgi:hypothetical protein
VHDFTNQTKPRQSFFQTPSAEKIYSLEAANKKKKLFPCMRECKFAAGWIFLHYQRVSIFHRLSLVVGFIFYSRRQKPLFTAERKIEAPGEKKSALRCLFSQRLALIRQTRRPFLNNNISHCTVFFIPRNIQKADVAVCLQNIKRNTRALISLSFFCSAGETHDRFIISVVIHIFTHDESVVPEIKTISTDKCDPGDV